MQPSNCNDNADSRSSGKSQSSKVNGGGRIHGASTWTVAQNKRIIELMREKNMDGGESEKSPSWDFVATELDKDFPSCNRKTGGTRDHYKEALKFLNSVSCKYSYHANAQDPPLV